jgi:UDP-N-acetylglucosamine--N-acetylmuramyl-(pentapeptide) pyrophosphoryl-undecaprenol N-acetylglucosamine transferase
VSATVAIATGGTGGHVFPALAVAQALRAHGHTPVLFTDRRGQRYLRGEHAAFELAAASPSGSLRRRLEALALLGRGTLRALRLFAEIRPQAAAAFGGYASFPAVLAAWIRRVPLVVHEQNAVLGRANRIAARFAERLLLSFDDTEQVPAALRGRIQVTGNPVRPEVLTQATAAAEGDGRLRLLVIGGSQGARRLGEVVPDAVLALPERLRQRLVVWMQVREDDRPSAAAKLADAGLAGLELMPFFADLPARLGRADLVIARAGASTVAELLAAGRPAILIPYPYAADDHQTANALRLERAGAAVRIAERELTSHALAATLATLLLSRERLAAMQQATRRLARPDAAERIAATLLSLLPAEARP